MGRRDETGLTGSYWGAPLPAAAGRQPPRGQRPEQQESAKVKGASASANAGASARAPAGAAPDVPAASDRFVALERLLGNAQTALRANVEQWHRGLVGRFVEVEWEKGEWWAAVVVVYNNLSRVHGLLYKTLDVERILLHSDGSATSPDGEDSVAWRFLDAKKAFKVSEAQRKEAIEEALAGKGEAKGEGEGAPGEGEGAPGEAAAVAAEPAKPQQQHQQMGTPAKHAPSAKRAAAPSAVSVETCLDGRYWGASLPAAAGRQPPRGQRPEQQENKHQHQQMGTPAKHAPSTKRAMATRVESEAQHKAEELKLRNRESAERSRMKKKEAQHKAHESAERSRMKKKAHLAGLVEEHAQLLALVAPSAMSDETGLDGSYLPAAAEQQQHHRQQQRHHQQQQHAPSTKRAAAPSAMVRDALAAEKERADLNAARATLPAGPKRGTGTGKKRTERVDGPTGPAKRQKDRDAADELLGELNAADQDILMNDDETGLNESYCSASLPAAARRKPLAEQHPVGYFVEEEAAARRRDLAAEFFWGPDAPLNFPASRASDVERAAFADEIRDAGFKPAATEQAADAAPAPFPPEGQEGEGAPLAVLSDTGAEHLSPLSPAPSEWLPSAPSMPGAGLGEAENWTDPCRAAAPARRLRSAADFSTFAVAVAGRADEPARAVAWASSELAVDALVPLLSQAAGSARLVCAADVTTFAHELLATGQARPARWANEDDASSEEEGDAQCPAGHVLGASKASELFEVSCDACGGACRAGARLLSCRQCNYDVHERCAGGRLQRPRDAGVLGGDFDGCYRGTARGSRRTAAVPAVAQAVVPAAAPAAGTTALAAARAGTTAPALDGRIVALLRAFLADCA